MSSRQLVLDPIGFCQPYDDELLLLHDQWRNAAPGRSMKIAHANLQRLRRFDDALDGLARTGFVRGMTRWPDSAPATTPFWKLEVDGYAALILRLPNDPLVDVLTFVSGFAVFDTLADRAIQRRAAT